MPNDAAQPAVPLSQQQLPGIAAHSGVEVPTYDRSRLSTGIVHVGVGGFHRAHQAMAIDRLLAQGLGQDFAICGVGLLPQDQRVGDVLRDQDHLYTLMLKHADGSRDARVIGSIVDFLLAPDNPEAVIERMARPETRIVSLTVTEGGYNVDPTTGEFLSDGSRHPARPRPPRRAGYRVRLRHRRPGPASRRRHRPVRGAVV